jgi:hypothetical protein
MRTCFIGYGFKTSPLEVDVLCEVLQSEGIEPVQAGDRLAAGQNAFCTKICSKIISSQFCAIIANNDIVSGIENPNANVYLEYGMMLAFNKHIIPFQLESQQLPFNVAGLDTVKYQPDNFKTKATEAVRNAVIQTIPDSGAPPLDVMVNMFCLANNVLVCRLDNEGEKALLDRVNGLGYSLLSDFTGWNYIYFGVFPQFTAQAIIWRLNRTKELLDGLLTANDLRVEAGFATQEQRNIIREVVSRFSIWLVVSDSSVKETLQHWHDSVSYKYPLKFFLDSDIRKQFDDIATGAVYNIGIEQGSG